MLSLVERPPAVLGSTQARDLVLLQRELVVVGDLFVDGDGLLRVDDDLLLGLYGDDLSVAVWLKEGRKRGKTFSGRQLRTVTSSRRRLLLLMETHSAAVVDEPRQVATLGGVDYCVVVHSEQVAAPDALLSVPLLSVVGHHLDEWSQKTALLTL